MWKYKLELSPDETLRFDERERHGSGHVVQRYSILGPQGEVTGSVQLTETALPASAEKRQLHLLQLNAWNDTVVDLRWTA